MILLDFFLSFFVLFFGPVILLTIRYPRQPHSLILAYGMGISFSLIWFALLLGYLFKIPDFALKATVWSAAFYIWYKIFSSKKRWDELADKKGRIATVWLMTFLILMPLFHYTGQIFGGWDAIVSWNRWALELYENRFDPIDAAYPVLLPGVWALFYKLQGTSDIWWTVKLTLFVPSYFTVAILLSLYMETRKSAYAVMAILLYPYLLWYVTYMGYMDMPVMVMGTLSLILLYSAETATDNRAFETRLYAALLIAALASIVKQAGLVFLVFVLLYTFLHRHRLPHPGRTWLLALLSLGFFASFLFVLYFPNANDSVTGNLDHLARLSGAQAHKAQGALDYWGYLWHRFFVNYPDNPWWIDETIVKPLHLAPVTPYLILVGISLFAFKDLRRYSHLNFLSLIFFFLGVAVWIAFFSYDERNSYWVKSFFILFFSINVGYVIDNRMGSRKDSVFFLMMFVILAGIVVLLGDSYAYEKQKRHQMKVGDPKLAAYIKKEFEKRDACFKVYVTDQILRYNHLLNPYRNRVIQMLNINEFKNHLSHTCKDGRLFVFRPFWRLRTVSDYFWKLSDDNIWKQLDVKVGEDTLFFVPPDVNITKDYFKTDTVMENFTIGQAVDNDLSCHIDQFKDYGSGLSIYGWAVIKNAKIDKTKKYIILKNGEKTYIVKTIPKPRPDITRFFQAEDLSRSGFLAHIYYHDFPPGRYDLYLLLVDPKDNSRHMTAIYRGFTIRGKVEN